MNKKYPEAVRHAIIEVYNRGTSVTQLSMEYSIPRSTVYSWLRKSQSTAFHQEKQINMQYVRRLENKVQRLEGLIEIIRLSGCSMQAPLREKLDAMERLYGQYNVHMLCDAMGVPRGTFYNHIKRNKRDATWYAKRREELRESIQRIYDESNQVFGAAKITAVLKREGVRVSIEMVRKLMQDMGLSSVRQNAKKLYEKENRKYKNYLNQNFEVNRPNQVWVSDVTCFRWKKKNYYICVVLDLYARRIVAHKVGVANSTQLVKTTFQMAYTSRTPGAGLTFHTDRGANYRSYAMCKCLRACNVIQSFSRAHIPYDNSVMESFFASLKREELYRTKYRSEREFRAAVDQYAVFYNEKRPHVRNQYKTPLEKETEYYSRGNG